jgi:hypothetical protein
MNVAVFIQLFQPALAACSPACRSNSLDVPGLANNFPGVPTSFGAKSTSMLSIVRPAEMQSAFWQAIPSWRSAIGY